MTKSDLYSTLADKLAIFWERDDYLLEVEQNAPLFWKQAFRLWTSARTIDDWLVTYRDDDRVSVEQYARNCERLLNIYRVDVWQLMNAVATASEQRKETAA